MEWCFKRTSFSAIALLVAFLFLHSPSLASNPPSSHMPVQGLSSLYSPLDSSQQQIEEQGTRSPSALLENGEEKEVLHLKAGPEVESSIHGRDKRGRPAWQSLHGSWGKRLPTQPGRSWNSFRGSWGKKADWRALRGSWGKRSVVDPAADLPNDLPIDLPANMAGDIPSDLATDLQKRAGWSSMQGSWGKRANPDEEEVEKRAGWSSLQGAWGKRNDEESSVTPHEDFIGSTQLTSNQDDRILLQDIAYILDQASPDMTDRILNDMQNSYRYNHEETNDESLNEGNNVALTKRNYGSSDWLKRPDGRLLLAPRSVNWSSLRGTWGKRGNPSTWSKLRGSWGKREEGSKWSHLRGSWGKRQPGQGWNSFKGGWGKRAADFDSTDED